MNPIVKPRITKRGGYWIVRAAGVNTVGRTENFRWACVIARSFVYRQICRQANEEADKRPYVNPRAG